MVKFATNASGAIWWPNIQLMQVAPSDGQICDECKWCHVVAEYSPSHGVNFWVFFLDWKAESANFIAFWMYASSYIYKLMHISCHVSPSGVLCSHVVGLLVEQNGDSSTAGVQFPPAMGRGHRWTFWTAEVKFFYQTRKLCYQTRQTRNQPLG